MREENVFDQINNWLLATQEKIFASLIIEIYCCIASFLTLSWVVFDTTRDYYSTDDAWGISILVFFLGMVAVHLILRQPKTIIIREPTPKRRFVRPTPPPQVTYVEQSGGYVYFLFGEGYTKIGKANIISDRLNQYAPRLPFETKVVHSIYSKDPLRLESTLHRMFQSKRCHGEWYRLDEEDFQRIREMGDKA